MVGNFTPLDLKKFKKKGEKYYPVGKEVEPVKVEPVKKEVGEIKIEEVVETEPSPEVREVVKPRQEVVKLPPDLKKLGLRPVSTTKFPATQSINLPLSDEKIIVGLHAPVTSSLRWLATLAEYILKTMHIQLKVISGRVVRVFRR